MLHGSGTTLQSVIDAINNGELDARINLVVSDKQSAYAIERAKKNNIDTYIINSKTKEDIDYELSSLLQKYDVNLIVLAGYLKMIGDNLINN